MITRLCDSKSSIPGTIQTTTAVIKWDEEATKTPGFRHDVDDNNSRVYVDNKGRYSLKVNVVAVNGAAQAVQIKMYAKVGPTAKTEGTAYGYAIGSGWRINLQINTVLDLEAGDYIQIETYVVKTGAGQAVTTSATECEFIVRRIA